jgi:GAF domain-containing protein
MADFFYPAVIELGDKDTPAQRPMRAALYDSEREVLQEFRTQLEVAIASVRAKPA